MDDHAYKGLNDKISEENDHFERCSTYEKMDILNDRCISQGQGHLLAFYLQATYGTDIAAIERDWKQIENAVTETLKANRQKH